MYCLHFEYLRIDGKMSKIQSILVWIFPEKIIAKSSAKSFDFVGAFCYNTFAIQEEIPFLTAEEPSSVN